MFAIAKMIKLLTEKSVVPKLLHFYGILQGYCLYLRYIGVDEDDSLTDEEREFLTEATEIITMFKELFPEEMEGGEPIKE